MRTIKLDGKHFGTVIIISKQLAILKTVSCNYKMFFLYVFEQSRTMPLYDGKV